MISNSVRGKKSIGTIRWAIALAVIVTFFSVVSYLLTIAIRYYFYGHLSDNVFIWSLVIYQIMGSLCGAVIAIISIMLYKRMDKLLIGMEKVAKGQLDVEIPLNSSGEYRVIYENFNRMVRELKNADNQQKQFIKDFSHEFKTPINSIKGMAEYLLQNEIPRGEETEYLGIISKEAGRLADLSQNTLLLSKLENMEIIRNKAAYRLDMQIRNSIIIMFPAFEKKNIKLNVELPILKYYGNEELLEEVWVNLLDNSQKYTPEGKTVTVTGKESEEYIQIEICDQGIGMDEETQKHIFDRYYQGDNSHVTHGFGLGLSIVKRIVELSDGRLEVNSIPQKGTSMFVILKKSLC